MNQKLISGMHNFSRKSFEILGIRFSSRPMNQLINEIDNWLLADKGKQDYLVTPNPEFIVAARKDPNFRKIINRAKISLPDGIGVIWAKYVLAGQGFWARLYRALVGGIRVLRGELAPERITGVDFMIALTQLAQKRGWRVFFLGASPGVAAKTGEILLGPRKKRINNSLILGANWAAFAGDGSSRGDQETVTAIRQAAQELGGPFAVLFVAYGMKKQEEWIKRNLARVPVRLAMGVGGAFDYLAGVVPRAPDWLRKSGLEWFYRLGRQPWRWRRQLNLLYFLFLVLCLPREKFKQATLS